jgi:hypothetical protein
MMVYDDMRKANTGFQHCESMPLQPDRARLEARDSCGAALLSHLPASPTNGSTAFSMELNPLLFSAARAACAALGTEQ